MRAAPPRILAAMRNSPLRRMPIIAARWPGHSGAARSGEVSGSAGPVGLGQVLQRTGADGAVVAFAAASGALMLALPALTAPATAQAITAVGVLAVAASLAVRWAPVGTLAATAAIALCVLARPAAGILAADGLLILGYLLLVDAPRHVQPRQAARGWRRAQAPIAAAALPVCGATLAAVTLPAAPSAWIAFTGAAAAVIAYLFAVPRGPRPPRAARRRTRGS